MQLYQIDAFAEKIFTGNPAAVCPLENWLPDELMQKIAMENNLAETAFYVPTADGFFIRWFTPTVEVDLCGHATLAAAYVLFTYEGFTGNTVAFDSKSGILTVSRQDNLLTLDFPVDTLTQVEVFPELTTGFQVKPTEAWKGKTDYMLVYETEAQIRALKPDFKLVSQVAARGIIVTASGEAVDFVSRFFGPQSGIDEDPVTGSAHTTLTPYWAKRLNKTYLKAQQLSARTGNLSCELVGNRVKISGYARTYLIGTIQLGGS